MDVVVMFAGDDELLLQRAVEAHLADLDDDVRVRVHDVAELDQLPELRTTSLFGEASCVVLRGVESVSGTVKDELERYLDAPSDETGLILVARGTGRIQGIVRRAKQHGRRVDVKRPADWDDRSWQELVSGEFARHQRQAEPAALAAIRAHAGTDPSAIASQVDSVCAVSTTPVVTAADVEAAVQGTGRASGFAVADAIAERDVPAALVALRGALDAGEAPLALAGAMVFRSRQLLQVRSGASAAEAGMSPGQHRRTAALAGRFGPGELAWCHDRLARLDLDLKGSDLPDTLMLEVAVVELATPRTLGAPWNPAGSA